ncbi:MAG: hypothetical protein GQ583_10640 [Methyloprofundus sp.]|nr:hypothetical protein [Methyloprofundus sp.]
MTHTKQVENLFGPDVERYFTNKQTGGNSNQKGSRYEDFFSVMQLAQLFQLLTNDDREDIEIYAQAEAFVDDLLIKYQKHNTQHHFQLKTSPTVNWGNGLKSIGDDFYKQKVLNDNLGIDITRTILVCSDKEKAARLQKKVPQNIADFADIIFFPEVDTINHLLLIHDEFKVLISHICFSNDIDKLEALAKLILGHWVDKKTTLTSVNGLLSTLENVFPNYLARSNIAVNLLPEVERIFSTITHFSFKIEKGYFSWRYHDFDSGTIPYSVDSTEFIAFQQEIASKCPRQFDELEGILL